MAERKKAEKKASMAARLEAAEAAKAARLEAAEAARSKKAARTKARQIANFQLPKMTKNQILKITTF